MGMRCYKCVSDVSWSNCDDEAKDVDCPPENNDKCLKVKYDNHVHKMRTFTKFCEKEDQCSKETNPWCKAASAQNYTCEINCCDDKDMCNKGSATRISGILVTCAALAVAAL